MGQFVELKVPCSQQDFSRHRIESLPIVILHIHSKCNCRCKMCDIWKTTESKWLTEEALLRMIPSLREMRTKWIVFSGGEPLLNPEWPGLCTLLKGEDIRVTLLTTGLLLERYASQVACHFSEVIVSLDGPEGVHDEIRQVRSAFALLKKGVTAVRWQNQRIKVSGRSTIQKENHARLRDTVQAAKELGLDTISFLAVDTTSRAFNRPVGWSEGRKSEVGLTSGECADLARETELLIAECAEEIRRGFIVESPSKLRGIVKYFRAQLGEAVSEAPVCNAPWVSAVVETDGTVKPCFFQPAIGNANRETLVEIENSDTALAFRASLDAPTNPICRNCVCSLNYR